MMIDSGESEEAQQKIPISITNTPRSPQLFTSHSIDGIYYDDSDDRQKEKDKTLALITSTRHRRRWRRRRPTGKLGLFGSLRSRPPQGQSLCNILVGFCVAILATVIFNAELTTQRPIYKRSADSLTGAMMYLMKYGYMDHHHNDGRSAQLLSADGLKNYIMDFQGFAGLNQTGVLDDETIKMMNMPRCGVKDNVGGGGHDQGGNRRRRKRYALQGSRWRVKELTYKISKYPSDSDLTRSQVDAEIKKALSVWSDHTDLKFIRKRSGKVHIDVRFEKKEHGDGDPFDGSGGTLAHAFFPVFGGDAHFDDDEPWTSNSFTGTSLLQTAAHEFGHSLGLSHSDTKDALMAPFYRGFQSKPKLEIDDVKGIQALYGPKSSKNDNKNNDDDDSDSGVESNVIDTGDPKEKNELCETNTRLDAIVTTKDTNTYVFKGNKYFKLNDDGVEPGYPRFISSGWGGLPSNIDAAFTWTNGKTYIFRGSKYWRFTNQNLDRGYPKPIAKGFDGIPDNIDAAFVWSGNGKIYFFKGDKYYRFDPEERPPVKRSYPKPVENWEGIPGHIDDALQYKNGYTYFFKQGRYWRFDDKNFGIDRADPPFPRPASYWWFGCPQDDA